MSFDGEVLRGKFSITVKYHNGLIEKYRDIVEIRNDIDKNGIVNSYILINANDEVISVNYQYVMRLTIKEHEE